jgi:hypothetical protein
VSSLAQRVKRHGIRNTLHYLVMRALALLGEFKILRGVWVQTPDPRFLEVPDRYTAEFFTPAADLDADLSERFLREAAARGDACYGIRQGAALAAYGWYARGPTPVSDDLSLHFSRDYVYMYKGFTDPRHRGLRLHAIGMTRALAHYRNLGYRGIVSYVESTNFDSLKSCFRMGYAVFGSVYMVKIFGRWLAFSSPGCWRFRFRVVPRGYRLKSGLLPDPR